MTAPATARRRRTAEVGGIRRGGTEGQNTRARADVLRRDSVDLTRALVALGTSVARP